MLYGKKSKGEVAKFRFTAAGTVRYTEDVAEFQRPIDAAMHHKGNEEMLLVWMHDKYKSMYTVVEIESIDDLVTQIHRNKQLFYEVVTKGVPCRFFCDFDAKGPNGNKLHTLLPTESAQCQIAQLLADAIGAMVKDYWPFLQDHDVVFRHQTCTAHCMEKNVFSMHFALLVIVNGDTEISFNDWNTVKQLYTIVNDHPKGPAGIPFNNEALALLWSCSDGSIYNYNRNMRMLYQSKNSDLHRNLTPIPGCSLKPTDHMITAACSHTPVPMLTAACMLSVDTSLTTTLTGSTDFGSRGGVRVPPYWAGIIAALPHDMITGVSHRRGMGGVLHVSTRDTGPCALFSQMTCRTCHRSNHISYVLCIYDESTRLLQSCHGRHAIVKNPADIQNPHIYAPGVECVEMFRAQGMPRRFRVVKEVALPPELQTAIQKLFTEPDVSDKGLDLWN